MANKTKLKHREAVRILGYFSTTDIEITEVGCLIHELMTELNMFENDKIFLASEKVQGECFKWTSAKFGIGNTGMSRNLYQKMVNIKPLEEGYVPSIDLIKFKIDLVELPAKLEQYVVEFYNKLIEIGTDVKTIESSKTEVLKSIKNMYFLTNEVKEVIESKV